MIIISGRYLSQDKNTFYGLHESQYHPIHPNFVAFANQLINYLCDLCASSVPGNEPMASKKNRIYFDIFLYFVFEFGQFGEYSDKLISKLGIPIPNIVLISEEIRILTRF